MIIEAAKTAYNQFWRSTSDESTGDKQAAKVTKAWQDMVASNSIKPEVLIKDNLKERIDVIDFSSATAYEMKVSSNNPHHEFYKDIFKVIIYNQHHKDNKVKRLVFITGRVGADKLKRGLGEVVMQSMGHYELSVEVVGIANIE